MTDNPTRVRFAPSPTGYLHVGGVRTALFNWLHARKVGGTFLLRVEDTDRSRSSDEHTQVILDGLEWIGLDWDEEVLFQGAGLERHQEMADRLITSGHAYEKEGATWFRMPAEKIGWEDLVHGKISFEGSDIKDWAILRSDRTPTYNLSVVADDLHMNITDVLRGDDHISNTPKQIAVYHALDATVPRFGHFPNVLGNDGKKLSKRHGATAIGDYAAEGFFPAAMRNFLSLIGWNPRGGDDRELFFRAEELIDAFSLKNVQKKSGVFDLAKLEWMNGQYLSQLDPAELIKLVRPDLEANYPTLSLPETERVLAILQVVRERARVTGDLSRQLAVRLDASFIKRDEKADKLIAKDPDGFQSGLREVHKRLDQIKEWNAEGLEISIRELAEELDVKLGKIMQPIRVALTGGTVSEGVPQLLAVVGREESLKRLQAAADWPTHPSS